MKTASLLATCLMLAAAMIFREGALLQELATHAVDEHDGNGGMVEAAHMGCMLAHRADGPVLRIKQHDLACRCAPWATCRDFSLRHHCRTSQRRGKRNRRRRQG